MKKLILVLTVSAFAVGAYAGGAECAAAAAKAGASCQEAKAGAACQDAKKAGATCTEAKASCCEKEQASKNTKKVKVVQSPKAAGESVRS